MAIQSTDIILRLSGGASNTDPNACLGGVMSTTTAIVDNTLHNLFDKVTGAESTAGEEEYRGFYILNNHGTLTLESAKIWVDSETTHTGEDFEIALCDEGVNVTMETIGDAYTAPSGPTFGDATGEGAALSLGDIAAGQRYGIWVKRTTDPATAAKNNYTIVLKIKGDTAE